MDLYWWPGILVPIVVFFGLSVFLSQSLADMALKNSSRNK
jgi:hypothetical protein